ncbi:alpha/beta hydrolase [Roseibium sp. RKSG952]|nr:alpha/beta hydrolase [Roseibium sp. RKSG952]MTH97556.1 alpha/beta hydrolase [Roseibium sp. RKSG952]
MQSRTTGIFPALLLCVFLAACSSRPEAGALAISFDPAPDATIQDILVVTTRQRDERPGTFFNGERRSEGLDFAEVKISVPPTHVPGKIEWPQTPPGNPETDFVVRDAGYIPNEAAFNKRLNERLAKLPKKDRTVFLFIHGYNTLFAESLYRFTQFVNDSEFEGVPVLFTWASRGNVQDYLYDLNSAAIARDALIKTVTDLADSKAENIVILAHSMGNWLLMEAASRVPPEKRKRLDGKIEQVVLAAPDIDIDLFKSQLRRLGKPEKPYVVIISKDDKALRLSRAIAGGKERVGAYSNDVELAELGAVVIDLTEVKSEDAANHGKFAQLAQVAPQLHDVILQDQLTSFDPNDSQLRQTGRDLGSFLTDAVTLPITIVTAPITLTTGTR